MRQKGFIREAIKSDILIINNFLKQQIVIHRHLDWRQPTEWLGKQPFLLYLSPNNSIEAILICIPEPKNIFWIRLFAYSNPLHKVSYWESLFTVGLKIITSQSPENTTIASLAYQKWMKDLLESEGWIEKQRVIQLKWNSRRKSRSLLKKSTSSFIRKMVNNDISEVAKIDRACFNPLWQHSREAIEHAHSQSVYSTVFEKDHSICGFQISTHDNGKAHLARLAVLPIYQKQHIGEQLVLDMLHHITKRGIKDISVNTQQDNHSSIGLYNKLNFKKTGDSFPIYIYN